MEKSFSEQIAAAVHESGMTVSKLSQMSGLGRTAIQHIISGDFLPTNQFLDELCSVLHLPPDRMSRIKESYFREKLGDRHYYFCKRMIAMMEGFSQNMNHTASMGSIEISRVPLEGSMFVNGMVDIITLCMNLVIEEMMKDDPHIMLTVPASQEQFFVMLQQTLNSVNSRIRIDHFVKLASEEGLEENFDKISMGMRLFMQPKTEYQPYYLYSQNGEKEDFFSPYPYCIRSQSYVLFMNDSLTSAVLTNNPSVHRQMDEYYCTMLRISKPLFTAMQPDDVLDICAGTTGSFISSIGYMPIFSQHFTRELMAAKLRPEYRRSDNSIKDPDRNSMVTHKKRRSYSIFTVAGLREFAETGMMTGVPGDYFMPLDPDERKMLLTKIMESGAYDIIDPQAFEIRNIQVVMLTERTVAVSITNSAGTYSCRIDDIFLISEMDVLIRSIGKMGMLLSDEEKRQQMEMHIAKLGG